MAKRKLHKDAIAEESDLSPPPEGLLDGTQAVAGVNGHAEEERPSKNRKATKTKEVTDRPVKEEDDGAQPAEKRTRKKQKVKVETEQVEEVEDHIAEGPETAPKKRRTRKKEVKEEEQDFDEDGNVIRKKVKGKRKTKAEKEAELVEMPLAARTTGHKLFIGAHVSAAGGQCSVRSSVFIMLAKFAFCRCPSIHSKLRSYRSQCLRSLSQVSAQVGQSAVTG